MSRSTTSATPTGGSEPASAKPRLPRRPSLPSSSSSRSIIRRARRSAPFSPKCLAMSALPLWPSSRRKASSAALSGSPLGCLGAGGLDLGLGGLANRCTLACGLGIAVALALALRGAHLGLGEAPVGDLVEPLAEEALPVVLVVQVVGV